MGLLPASPRARRRLGLVAIPAGLALAGLAVALAIPSHGPGSGAPAGTEGAASIGVSRSTQVGRKERRAIDALLDRLSCGPDRRSPTGAPTARRSPTTSRSRRPSTTG